MELHLPFSLRRLSKVVPAQTDKVLPYRDRSRRQRLLPIRHSTLTQDGWMGFNVPFNRSDYIMTCLLRQIKCCHTGTGVADKGSFPPVTVH